MNTITVDGVRISVVGGKIQLNIPPHMTGKLLQEWREANADAIADAKALLLGEEQGSSGKVGTFNIPN